MEKPQEHDFTGITYADKWGDYADALDKYIEHSDKEKEDMLSIIKEVYLQYFNATHSSTDLIDRMEKVLNKES